MKKTFNRALSVILAVLMLVSAMPIAFAATPISLKAANVTVWPTATGEMYYGQIIGEHITLTGGEVQYNGEIVPGHFEHVDPEAIAEEASDEYEADIKFVPDDTTAYKGFTKYFSKTTYVVHKTTPVLADAEKPPVVSNVVEPGVTLSNVVISDGAMVNPYYVDESNVKKTTWAWANPNMIVSESGYYEAIFKASAIKYVTLTENIYVEVNNPVPFAEIKDLPTIDTFDYNPNITWADVELKGGVAIIRDGDTTTEVSGVFALSNENLLNKVPSVGSFELDVKFTPNDSEQALPCECKVPVTVNAATVKFVDESGNETIPEITIDRVLEVGDDLNGYLKPYLNASCSFNYEETEGYGEKIKPGTHEYTVKTISDDPNYERYGTLTFKIVLNKEKVNAKVKNVVGGKQIYIEGGDTYHLNGNFDVKYFIDGKEAGIIEDVEFNKPFTFSQDKSGVYTYEIVYNGTEDDYYDITVITEAEDIKLQHQVKVAGQEAVTYKYGDTVTINAPAHEKPYYEFTGWVNESGITLTDEQRSAESISTTMPDNDIELEATYKFNFSLFIKYIFDVICSWFAKIAAFITGAFAV